MTNTKRLIPLAGLGLLVGGALSTLNSCQIQGLPGCGLSCPAQGVREGNGSITGVPEIDAFFGAVVSLNSAATEVGGSLRAELDAIALSVGLQPGATGTEIATAIDTKLGEAVEGLQIHHAPPRCEADVSLAVSAASRCDAELDPATAVVECAGACEIEGGSTAACEGNAKLTCTGAAPMLQCTGDCEGDCELATGAECSGTCRGTCSGTCTVLDAQGDCAGACQGLCQGTCELAAGGTCMGECTGECTYQPGDAGCEADASARCEAGGGIPCDGRCMGRLEPPAVKDECEATVAAEAGAAVQCLPSALELTWQWKAGVTAEAQAQFRAWARGFERHLSLMLAANAEADRLGDSLGVLLAAAEDTLGDDFASLVEGDFVANYKVASCALPELDTSIGLLDETSTSLSAEAAASLEVLAALGI